MTSSAASPSPSSPPRSPARKRTVLPGLITGILLVAVFYFGKPVLMPLALAILFAFLLSPLVNFLHRRFLPRALAVMLVTVCVFSLLGLIGWIIGREFSLLAESLPNYKQNIHQRITSFYEGSRGGVVDRLKEMKETIEQSTREASGKAREAGDEDPERAGLQFSASGAGRSHPPAPSSAEPGQQSSWLSGVLGTAGEVLGNAATVIVFVIFILLKQQELRNRLMRLAGFRHVTVVTRAMDETGERVGRYLMMQALINGLYGITLATGLYFIGMPYVVLWGVLAALFRFIPYVGPVMVAVLPSVLSLAVFNDWYHPLMVIALILGLELLTNMILEPVLYGQSVGVSEFSLLVAIVFWTWLWGGIGLVMATPLTVCLVVMAKHVPSLQWVEILMGEDPRVKPYMVLYQRLLAGDEEEAAEFVAAELKHKPPLEVVDGTLLPAISLAKRELRHNRMEPQEETRLHEAILRVMEQVMPLPGVPAAAAGHKKDPGSPKNGLVHGTPPEASLLHVSGNGALAEAARPLILGRALDEGADEAALRCMDRMLPAGVNFEVIPATRLTSELLAEIAERAPAALLISATPPGSHSTVRLQLRRIRQQFPRLRVFVGRWGVPEDVARGGPLKEAGATAVFTTLGEAQTALTAIVREAAAIADAASAAQMEVATPLMSGCQTAPI